MNGKFLISRYLYFTAILVGIMVTSCNQDELGLSADPNALDPGAELTGAFSTSSNALEVNTINNSINGRAYAWDFGGEIVTEDNDELLLLQRSFDPVITYAVGGTYTITLIVSGDGGQEQTITQQVTVGVTPMADFTFEADGLMVAFTDATITDDGNVTGFEWDFGDGIGTSTEQNPSYTYTDAGDFDATLTITFDEINGETTASTTQTVSVTGLVFNQLAFITDTSADDTGELRLNLETEILVGRMTATINKQMTQDGFINVSGSSTSRRNAMIDIRVDDGDGYSFTESGDTVNDLATFPAFVNDEFVEVEITWDASGDGAPLVTVTIDGQAVTDAPFASEGQDPTAIAAGVRTVQFRVGGGGDLDDSGAGMFVDDLQVFDSTSGMETLVFEDDYETYTAGNSLDPDADTAGNGPILDAIIQADTPYNNNSFQVTVVEVEE